MTMTCAFVLVLVLGFALVSTNRTETVMRSQQDYVVCVSKSAHGTCGQGGKRVLLAASPKVEACSHTSKEANKLQCGVVVIMHKFLIS